MITQLKERRAESQSPPGCRSSGMQPQFTTVKGADKAPVLISATVRERAEAVEPAHPDLSIAKQCEILGINRSAYYYKPEQTEDEQELTILKAILEVLGRRPFYGYRKVARELADLGVTRKQVRRIMKRAGLRALYPGKRMNRPGFSGAFSGASPF